MAWLVINAILRFKVKVIRVSREIRNSEINCNYVQAIFVELINVFILPKIINFDKEFSTFFDFIIL